MKTTSLELNAYYLSVAGKAVKYKSHLTRHPSCYVLIVNRLMIKVDSLSWVGVHFLQCNSMFCFAHGMKTYDIEIYN